MRAWILSLVVCGCSHHESPPETLSPDAAVTPGPCNGDTCTANEYCYLQYVGAVGGVAPSQQAVGCNPLPSSCVAAATCACVVPAVPTCSGATPSCDESAGVVTITCAYP